nr:phytoene desaturase [Anaerolineae bacterium]
VATAYRQLLPQTEAVQKRLAHLSRQEPSCSGFVMLLGVRGQDERLAHHNILFSRDYPREFRQIFKDRTPPDDPTVYISITSKTDAQHAPDGHENWFVLVNMPAVTEGFDWAAQQAAYRERVLARMAEFGFDVRGRIAHERVLTPTDLQAMTGAFRGALYGASANSKWTAFGRPHNRCADVRGVYFAGGTTHPGGGVPMVTLSGKVAAGLVIEDAAR